MSAYRIVIADDHPVYREGLARNWSETEEFSVIGQSGDGRHALAMILREQPDVAVLDLRLPGMDGLAVLEQLRDRECPTRVLILTAYVDSATVFRAFSLGARGFMEKVASSQEIADTITAIAEGRTVMTTVTQDIIADELRLRETKDARPPLTSREIEILRLAAEGNSSQQIALSLFISVATVKTHLQHIYEKLEVSDRAAAVAQALRNGVLS
ncbi:response regulator transcription factor [Leucobacter weissii]|uniref:Response regulator transcription factor n=1 Tax=Leucobacter weissii TaxID=1983706 RepID=A0A939MH10_9MICO|nr:response regulator transcription factor [Leucobacter weissii]MBO1900548.1 response regulator transcription factor [Leucobacter weissii]